MSEVRGELKKAWLAIVVSALLSVSEVRSEELKARDSILVSAPFSGIVSEVRGEL